MTDDELLVKSLEKIRTEAADERACITRTDRLNSQIAAEYDDEIENMERIFPKIKTVLDIWNAGSEEDFLFIIDSLENYSENFVIDGRSEEKRKEGEAEFKQLQDILAEFYDDGEDEEGDGDSGEDNEDSDEEESGGDESGEAK